MNGGGNGGGGGGGGGGANINNALDTITAAASAFASTDDRVPQSTTVPKRKWWNRWSISKCFGSINQNKKTRHCVLIPNPIVPISESPILHPPSSFITLPFIAPPSSPASFLHSDPPSSTQSPMALLSFSPKPNNPPSIFAIGPYAYDTRLVSPPVLSTYTTEPSTAPFTPPPESIHLTNPSSPEVPFAQLFNHGHTEFHFYHLPPGSPLAQLISPSSVMSNSDPVSPFTDCESAFRNPKFPHFPINEPPKLLSPPSHLSTLNVPKINTITPLASDRTAEHVIRCVEQKLRTTFPEASADDDELETFHHQSNSIGSVKEFNFSTDEKEEMMIIEEDRVHNNNNNNNWSFFPVPLASSDRI